MRSLVLGFLFILMQTSLLAKSYRVNDQHSFVNFEVDYMKVSKVMGAFEKFEGHFEWDPDKKNLKEVQFKIMADSLNTRDKKRDNHLFQDEFLHIKDYPLIEFESKKVIYQDGFPSQMVGLVTLRGITKETVFNLQWLGEHQDAVDKKKKSLFVKASGVLNRKDFNLNWNKSLDQGGWIVGDDIRVELVIEANSTDATPAFSRFYINKNSKVKKGTYDLDKVLQEPLKKKSN